MRRLFILAAFAAFSGLAGCGVPVYGKSNFLQSPGYSDKSLGEGSWEVTFRTMGRDRENLYEAGALYRSAELAREAGFPYFQVVRFEGRVKTERPVGTPPDMGVPVAHFVRLTVRGVHTREEELKCESEAPRDCGTFSTEDTLRRLGPKLGQSPVAEGTSPPP
jgi:hypothetical protein